MGPSKPTSLVVLGTVALVLGTLFAAASVVRTGTTRFEITVTVRDGVAWDLWIPRPNRPMEVEAFFPTLVEAGVDTPYGTMDAFHGNGPGSFAYVWRWTVLRSTPLEPEGFVDLTGREDTSGFRVQRSSADPAAPIHIETEGYVAGQQLTGRFSCGTWFYGGDLAEGWNLLPYEIGDCVVRRSADPLPLLAVFTTVALAGAVPVALAGVTGLRRRSAA